LPPCHVRRLGKHQADAFATQANPEFAAIPRAMFLEPDLQLRIALAEIFEFDGSWHAFPSDLQPFGIGNHSDPDLGQF
jgi:hypothetical protein